MRKAIAVAVLGYFLIWCVPDSVALAMIEGAERPLPVIPSHDEIARKLEPAGVQLLARASGTATGIAGMMRHMLGTTVDQLGVPSSALAGPEPIDYPDGKVMQRYSAFGLTTWNDYLVDMPSLFYFDYLDDRLAVIMCQMPIQPPDDVRVVTKWLERTIGDTYDYRLTQDRRDDPMGGYLYLRDREGCELVMIWDVPASMVFMIACHSSWSHDHPWIDDSGV